MKVGARRLTKYIVFPVQYQMVLFAYVNISELKPVTG